MKVLIVDDEVIIREAIYKVVPWEEHGFQVLNPASSAEEALTIIQKERPEIILTDIKMGGKSGLDLASEVQHLDLQMEVIVLTGFSEFAYVQQAIREGVCDYLLKTSSEQEILAAVHKAKSRVQDKKKQANLEMIEDHRKQSTYLSRLINKDITMQERQNLLDMVSLEKDCFYQIIYLDTFIEMSTLKEMDKEWNKYLTGWWFLINNKTIILTQRSTSLQDEYLLKMAIQKLYPKIKEPFLVGSPVIGIDDIPRSFEQAHALIVYKWILKDKYMIKNKDIHKRQGISSAEFINKYENQFLKIVGNGNKDELQSWLELKIAQMIEHPQTTPESIHLNIQSLYISMVHMIHRVASSVGKKIDEMPELLPVHQWLRSPKKVLVPTFIDLLEIYQQLASDEVSFVQIAIEYMEMNIDKSITLTEVAELVHVHPNYLSDMLRKRTGKSYVELITELRMQKAKELLMNSTTKVKIISHQVGYLDWKYFTAQFKKITGQTPSQFREKKKRDI